MIARLTECYQQDLLDIDELDRLLDQAHALGTIAELDELVAGLGESTAALPIAKHATDDPTRLQRKYLTVMFSSIERTGRWVVPRTLVARAMFATVVLDFRDASIAAGTTTLDLSSTFGSVELVLPPWLAINVDVASIGGAVEERHRLARDPDPTEPVLHVNGVVRFGNLCITTRLPGESPGQARKREKRERRELAAGRALPPARGQM
ncbi:MAG TPA: hypothetical protein VIV11_31235 [Kofleriaceae bacterium]